MYYLKHLWSKITHNNPLRIFLDGLARLGVQITPFYLTLEERPQDPPEVKKEFDQYTFGLLGPEDMKTIAALPLRPFTEEDLRARLRAGCICVGVKHEKKLAAFAWANLKESTFEGCRFALKNDEAYLFDAFTYLEYRGRGLAPIARYHVYNELEKLGKTRFYSYTDCFNKSSLRFKEKLGAKRLRLGLLIKLFNNWTFAFRLTRFPEKS